MVCRELDSYVNNFFDIRQPIWIAYLSNGETIYQDDGRPGFYPASAWLRLKNYCRQKEVYIVGMEVQFRSNKLQVPRDADGYFFTKACGVWIGQDSTEQYGIGTLDRASGIVHVDYFQIPELCIANTMKKFVEDCEDKLICGLTQTQK